MSFRFRRTFTILPGVHVNLSKSGSSVSLGRRGAMVNVGHGHETVSLGVPGTGLGYRTSSGSLILWLLVLGCVVASRLVLSARFGSPGTPLVATAVVLVPERVSRAGWRQPKRRRKCNGMASLLRLSGRSVGSDRRSRRCVWARMVDWSESLRRDGSSRAARWRSHLDGPDTELKKQITACERKLAVYARRARPTRQRRGVLAAHR